jgi:hypothetical protein
MRLFEMFCARSIDHGAHPNEMAVTGSATMFREPGRISLRQNYLHADGTAFEHALKSTAQVGHGILYVFQWIYLAKFEVLGVKQGSAVAPEERPVAERH